MHRTAPYDVMPIQVWTARPDGSLDYINPAVTGYFSVDAARILEHGWKDLVHPLDLTHAGERWAHSLATGEPYEIAFRLIHGIDRQYRWHIGNAVAVRDADGAITHWVGTNAEIDHLKRAEEVGRATLQRTQREHERWLSLFAQLPLPVVVTAGPLHRVELRSAPATALAPGREIVGELLADAFPALHARIGAAELDRLYAGVTESLTRAPDAPAGEAATDGGDRSLHCQLWRGQDGEIGGLMLVLDRHG